MKNGVYVMIGARPAYCLYVAKTFNVVIFSDTINVINVKLCMMVVPINPFLAK